MNETVIPTETASPASCRTDALDGDSIPPSNMIRLKVKFTDQKGRLFVPSLKITCQSDDGLLSERTVLDGILDTLVDGRELEFFHDGNYFHFELDDKAGAVVEEEVRLPYFIIKGRIMESDGTPLVKMPVRLHQKFKRKRGEKEDFENDVLLYTDGRGYYESYVSAEAVGASLRSCGFLVGNCSRSELVNYPTQNFLFEPFSIRNICGEDIPDFRFTMKIEDSAFDFQDKKRLFEYDGLFEKADAVRITAKSDRTVQTKKITKRNGVFRNPSFTICHHD